MENDYNKYQRKAEILKVLAHPVRLCIVRGLMESGECNVSHMQLCLDAPQSTISQHLQKLRAAGILDSRRSGLEIYYCIRNKAVEELIRVICSLE